jgi:hypothetical protein
MAIDGPARLSDEAAALAIGMINAPEESWWVVVHALNRLAMAKPELLAPHVDRLCYWLQHDEWWLRMAALQAVKGLVADERYYQKLLPLIGKLAETNRVADVMGPMRGITASLTGAKPEVQALAIEVLGDAYAGFPKTLAAPGGLNLSNRTGPPSPVTFLETELATNIAATDGGLDRLYELAKRRFPELALPHRELFLGAPPEKLGPTTQKVIGPIISASLVPEHVGKNWKTLRGLAAAQVQNGIPGGRNDPMDQLADLYRRAGDTTDYAWHAFGPDRHDKEWAYLLFDPAEKKEWDGSGRYRPVTLPDGMAEWFSPGFDAAKAGWRKGQAPFVNVGGKLQAGPCQGSPCGCGDEPATLWDKEVLLIRRTFELPPLKPGRRYRMLVGGSSHVGTGEGWAVYVNGRKLAEEKGARGRNSGGLPKGAFITTEWFDVFKNGGTVDVAAIAFLSARKDKQNNINIWFEEMTMPSFDAGMLRQWATQASMMSADWQAKQDPNRNADDPEAGKFRWDGTVAANPALLGAWTTVAMVPSIEAFDPAKPVGANGSPFKSLTFNPDGTTDEPLRLWTGDMLLDLGSEVHRPLSALKMTVKGDHLFVEAGGFSDKNPVGWKSPLIVLQRAAQ